MQSVFITYDTAETFVFVSHATTILIFVRELLGLPMSMECAEDTVNVPANLTTILVSF